MFGFPFDSKKSILKNFHESKEINLSVKFYNRVWAIPVSGMYYDIINNNLDYYSFENIVLPSTKYMSADEVNKLYFRPVSKKDVFEKKVVSFLGKKNIGYIQKKFPKVIDLYRKLINL